MLPYGTLWKLDQLLHPVGPPQRRTVVMRRRQALFYFLWGVFLVTIFLFPYHYSSLRRLRLDGARRLRGVSAPTLNLDVLRERQGSALRRLQQRMAARDDKEKDDAKDADGTLASISADFSMAFYYHPETETRLRGIFHHPVLRAIVGDGAGRLWKSLSDNAAPDASHAWQRQTLSEAVAERAEKKAEEPAICLVALQKDYLVSRLGVNADAGTELMRAVRTALPRFATLYPISLSSGQTAAANVSVKAPSIEIAFAQLFLWLADDGVLEDEALNRAVAGCAAPLSRSLEVSFAWQAASSVALPRTALVATVREVEVAQPQYVCLCYGSSFANATVLTDIADGEAPTLFLADRHHADPGKLSGCKDVCARRS
ncbi:hypothetical protein ABB37_00232 [Leptomonas pyrrhocoris]|uniref:Transmembrane protein n=1 Tax=Leptomonas pyrrhocoris TaxID=157538 RepID=A0A0N0E016_LEPPY|nr:hypothetical protein ABB37_00232 [Leptomonas pyrrhocoris]KPA85925.1 hypothetical protein ABB37_00232 [Leptomonas pyrrhocoris]|eukprot:XP_015664364.1 hypothetical protein ABB37_00232 [Leptomonas pyrrhocoris]